MKEVVVNPELWTQNEVQVGSKIIGREEPVEVTDDEFKTLSGMTGNRFGTELALVVEAKDVEKVEQRMETATLDEGEGGATTQTTDGGGQPRGRSK